MRARDAVAAMALSLVACNAIGGLGDLTFVEAFPDQSPDTDVGSDADDSGDSFGDDARDDTASTDAVGDTRRDVSDPCDCTTRTCGALRAGCASTCVAGSGCCLPACVGKKCGSDDSCGGACAYASGCDTVGVLRLAYDDPRMEGHCPGFASRDTTGCLIAAHIACVREGWTSGFPTASDASAVTIRCVAGGSVFDVTSAQLASYPNCSMANRAYYSFACDDAAKQYCVSRGFGAGFGLVDAAADHVTVTCLPSELVTLLPNVLSLAGCAPPTKSYACDAAADDACVAKGKAAGLVDGYNGVSFTLLCINPSH